jgi:hypothetical protein
MQYRHTYPAILFLLFSFLLIGILKIPSIHAARRKEESSAEVPIDVLQKAMRYVKQHNYGNGDGNNALQAVMRLESGDVHTLYKVAQAMNGMENKEDRLASIEIWHALASNGDGDGGGHVLSQVALGFAYSENDKATAVTYFVQAGETGPHQAALFNAGRLLVDPEMEDFVKALAYFRAAYSLGETHPNYSTTHLTETSKVAYERLSEQLATLVNQSISSKGNMLSIQQVADMFLYADLNNFPPDKSKEEKIWARAMRSLQSKEWEIAYIEFEKLEKNSKEKLSKLQTSLLYVLKQYCNSESGIDLNDEL